MYDKSTICIAVSLNVIILNRESDEEVLVAFGVQIAAHRQMVMLPASMIEILEKKHELNRDGKF